MEAEPVDEGLLRRARQHRGQPASEHVAVAVAVPAAAARPRRRGAAPAPAVLVVGVIGVVGVG